MMASTRLCSSLLSTPATIPSRVSASTLGALGPCALGLGALVLAPSSAFASSGIDVPDAGVLQLGRGSAWVARADDPLAAYMNPAAMSFQTNGIAIDVSLMVQDSCFARKGPGNVPVSPGSALPAPGAEKDGPPAAVCSHAVFPNPQLAAVFKPTDRFAIGLALLGPHTVGSNQWPESLDYEKGGQQRSEPAPNRYLVTSKSAVLLSPTISVSYAVTPWLSFGAGFIWGIGTADFTTYTEALSPTAQDDFFGHQDVKAHVTAKDLFIPGFVVGANWIVTDRFDMGAWYHFSDALRANANLDLTSENWLQSGLPNKNPCTGTDKECNITKAPDSGSIKFQIPMEAKLGVRYHQPLDDRARPPHPKWQGERRHIRDPLTQDRWDLGVDLTWANNSAVDAIEIRFGPEACRYDPTCTSSNIPVKGTPGSVPVNGDVPHHWKDVLGVRVGSDVTVLPGRLALRGGSFFESKGVDDKYLNIDFHLGWRLGFSGGGTVRVGPVDLSVAYQHVFYGTLDNKGDGALKALSGDGSPGLDYRSRQNVNGGSFGSSLNELALGGTLRF